VFSPVRDDVETLGTELDSLAPGPDPGPQLAAEAPEVKALVGTVAVAHQPSPTHGLELEETDRILDGGCSLSKGIGSGNKACVFTTALVLATQQQQQQHTMQQHGERSSSSAPQLSFAVYAGVGLVSPCGPDKAVAADDLVGATAHQDSADKPNVLKVAAVDSLVMDSHPRLVTTIQLTHDNAQTSDPGKNSLAASAADCQATTAMASTPMETGLAAEILSHQCAMVEPAPSPRAEQLLAKPENAVCRQDPVGSQQTAGLEGMQEAALAAKLITQRASSPGGCSLKPQQFLAAHAASHSHGIAKPADLHASAQLNLPGLWTCTSPNDDYGLFDILPGMGGGEAVAALYKRVDDDVGTAAEHIPVVSLSTSPEPPASPVGGHGSLHREHLPGQQPGAGVPAITSRPPGGQPSAQGPLDTQPVPSQPITAGAGEGCPVVAERLAPAALGSSPCALWAPLGQRQGAGRQEPHDGTIAVRVMPGDGIPVMCVRYAAASALAGRMFKAWASHTPGLHRCAHHQWKSHRRIKAHANTAQLPPNCVFSCSC
jgi:hypothetical protein